HLFDAVGYPELSRRFLSDGTVEETAFVYEGGRLVTRSTALNGNPVSVVRYLYAPDGRLLVARDDAGAVIGSAYQAGGASRMWRVADGLVELREYDSSGRLVSLSSYEGAKRLYYEERSWQGGVLQKTVVMDAEGASTSTWFATEGAALGKPTVALILLPDGTEASDSNLYDEAGRLMVRESASSSGSSRVEYTYDAVGALLVERRFSDGLPSMVVRYESDGVRVEESYEKGVAFARVRYEDGRKVLEEILKNGLVVRSRSFE
ncbi:MAG: hypothetical protein JXM71_04445, partial [Spirochaetales bacterium]|nr:hypothetical protein [Spirochaetales bacterium]